jgi:hypothetical protein
VADLMATGFLDILEDPWHGLLNYGTRKQVTATKGCGISLYNTPGGKFQYRWDLN